jgi:hypothetical protein
MAVSMLRMGTEEWAASSWSIASGPVRIPTAQRCLEKTIAVSRSDSPRESWRSVARRITGWPPSSWMPASKERRVRVEGCSKISATLRPSSAREESGAAFSAAARPRSPSSSPALSSAPVR